MQGYTYDELKTLGLKYLRTSDYPKAIELFAAAIALKPFNADKFVLRGEAYDRSEKRAEAHADFLKAADLDPENYLAQEFLGAYALEDNDQENGEAFLLRAVALNPQSEFSCIKLAQLWFEQHQTDRCLDWCNKNLAQNPELLWALDYRSLININRKNFAAARTDLELLLELDPGNAFVYNNTGFLHTQLGELEEAETWFEQALQLDADNAFALNNLGEVYLLKGELAEALRLINRSLELEGDNAYALKNRAKVYLALNETENAKTDLFKAREMGYADDFDDEVDQLLKQF